MGKQKSKKSNTRELRSYEADAEFQTFDHEIISTLPRGVVVRALTFDSFRQVTGCLLEMNQEVVKVTLDPKEDVSDNQELVMLVQNHLGDISKTLDFCAALEKELMKARHNISLLEFGFPNISRGGNGYEKTLQELKNIKDFLKMFQSFCNQQISDFKLMDEKLQLLKNKLDKKLKSIHIWRKLSKIILATTLATIFICSAVGTAMAAPPVVATLTLAATTATTVPLRSILGCIDSLWKNDEDALKGQREVIISSMQAGTYVLVNGLDKINVLIERLKTAESAVEHEAVKINGNNEIKKKKKLEVFMKNVDELKIQADLCSEDIILARTKVIQKIARNPNNGNGE